MLRSEHDNGGRRVGAAQRRWHPPRTDKMVSRPKLYAKKYVDLDQYIADYKAMRIASYAKLPRQQRIQMFGTTIVPIHVPLARGESAEQYEERFVQWLTRKGFSLRELETSENDFLERVHRIDFANLNATGEEAFVAPFSHKRPQTESCESPKRRRTADENVRVKSEELRVLAKEDDDCCVKRPVGNASTVEVVDALTACGCRKCVVETMRFLATKITQLDELAS